MKEDCKIMGPKVRVQWGSGPKSLRRMNHIPEKASQPNPYTAAVWGTEGLVRYYLFSSTLVVEVCVSFYVFWDADNPILGLFGPF